jgi:hypothetical protein
MSRGRQKVSFEGLLQENVLGTYKIIRGFANLRDLTEVSVAFHLGKVIVANLIPKDFLLK